jgi:hypothetical protein
MPCGADPSDIGQAVKKKRAGVQPAPARIPLTLKPCRYAPSSPVLSCF